MRWRAVGVGVLSLGAMLGCPDDYGREGTIDRAVHKDAVELQGKRCSEEERKRYCKNTKSAECREKCG